MSVRKHDYNAIDWHSLVYYDETSPSGLRWKVNRKNQVKCGDVAGKRGRVIKGGHWFIKLDKKSYSIHNVVFILRHGKLEDDKIVDHIDGDGSNNCIENLRSVLPHHNMHNQKINSRNKSGIPGVRYDRIKNSWVGCVLCNNRREIKSFACNRYGPENARLLAIQYVFMTRNKLNASGQAAFTDRHIGIDTSINSSSKQENTLDACFQQD